ncbi:MAG: acetolactate synthase small subunit [SAR324 cluster bacterium]|nr:acetolactate synthase small subunit [SAR324 cluster bacterium]
MNEIELETNQQPKYTISILVNNKPGVLMRITQTFSRRGYNIDSLVVSPAHNPQFSRLTMVTQGEIEGFDQIIRQLNKLVDVVHAHHHVSTHSIERELAMFKIGVSSKGREEVLQIVEVFRAKVLDFTENSLIVEATGSTEKLDALEKILTSLGIIEMVRSGKVIMARGMEMT